MSNRGDLMPEINLMVGYVWDNRQLAQILRLNDQYSDKGIRINEVYGSMRSSVISLPSARPDFRIPKVSLNSFEEQVATLIKNGVAINYTCNSTLNNNVKYIQKQESDYIKWFKYLEEVGVSRVTVANPLLIEILRSCSNLPIEISTIMNPTYISSLKYYKEWGVDKVCLNIYMNRNINQLNDFQKYALSLGIDIQLIVNEFCSYGSSPCLGLLRGACFEHSSNRGNKEKLFDGWPFNKCHQARMEDKTSWLRAPFILPQHLRTYQKLTGIHEFKITGRTNSLDHVNFLMGAYMAEEYGGQLIDLWIDPASPNKQLMGKIVDLTCDELIDAGLFDNWFTTDKACNYDCGFNCNWCDLKFDTIQSNRGGL